MQTLSWTSIAFYCAFGVFVFYQQLHVKNFRGASQGFALALNLSAFAGMLTGVAYLILLRLVCHLVGTHRHLPYRTACNHSRLSN